MIAALQRLLGAGAVHPPAPGGPWAEVDGHRPEAVAHPAGEEEAGALLRLCSENRWSVIPSGAGHALGRGPALHSARVVLCLDRLAAIVLFEPADQVAAVQAGVPLERLAGTAAAHGLRLPLAPPRWRRATAGGAGALGRSGAGREKDGRVRDLLRGVRAVLADGTAFAAGGRVIKNVAGYDLTRLLAGSRGALAVITEIAFSLRPAPAAAAALAAAAPLAREAAVKLAPALLDPALDLRSCAIWPAGGGWGVAVALAGEAEDVADRRKKLPGGEWAEDGGAALAAAEEAPWSAADGGRGLLVRFAVPRTALLPLAGLLPAGAAFFADLLTGRGEACIPAELLPRLRAEARAAGGFAVAEAGPPADRDRQAALDRAEDQEGRLYLALKRRLDPAGILAPGRLG